jgi:hypothetical protein
VGTFKEIYGCGRKIMKKRRIILTIAIIFAVCIVGAGIFIVSRATKEYPPLVNSLEHKHYYTEKGEYYIQGNNLYFLDKDSLKSVILCNKANCNHDSEDCNSYVESPLFTYLSYYDGYIFENVCNTETVENEDGEVEREGTNELRMIKEDGSERKTIFSSEDGAVGTLRAQDGVIYFDSYLYHGGFKVNEYQTDDTLYSYDLRWGKLKTIKTFEADDNVQSSNLSIVGGDSEEMYVRYQEYKNDDSCETTLMKYEDGELNTIANYDGNVSFYICKEKRFEIHHDDEDWIVIDELNDDFTIGKELISAQDAWVDYEDGYLYVISSDYDKVLYDYEEDKTYIANTCFTDEGTYISDVLRVIRDADMVYIDTYDYTGIMPGDALTGTERKDGIVSWSDFVADNFTPLEDVSETDIKGFTWLELSDDLK